MSNQPPEDHPMILRMLHPTSSQEGFNTVTNQTPARTQVPIDPRFARMINMQTQQAIAASGVPARVPNPGTPYYQSSPYIYGAQQPYSGISYYQSSPYIYGFQQPYPYYAMRR
jgi:hypothetical protein